MANVTESAGLDFKLYRNSGSYGTPVWDEITKARDVTRTLTRGTADVSSRASTWKSYVATLLDGSFDISMAYDNTGAGSTGDQDALRDAFMSRNEIELAFADGPIGTAGTVASGGTVDVDFLRITVTITGFTINEPLEDGVTVDVTCVPAPAANAPSWVLVT
jgi:hypothetical protein